MRILFFSNAFPNPAQPTRGPFNRALLGAVAQNHAVHVVSPISWVDEVSAWRQGKGLGSRSATLSSSLTATYPRWYYTPRVLRSQYGHFMWHSVRSHLLQQSRLFKPDAIVSYWAHPDGEVAVRLAERLQVPSVAMVGGSDILLLARSGSRRRVILKTLHAADAVVPVSGNLRDTLLADGIPDDKLTLIPRGVDRAVFRPGNREDARHRLGVDLVRPFVIAVGRLVPVKGFEVLINAMHLLSKSGTPPQLVIIGGGELRGALQQQIRQLGLQETVKLVGAQTQEVIADWYRAANLVALSSHSEGIPNVLLEALATGVPFVSTHVGGVADIADEQHHTLVPPNDPRALAEAIHKRMNTPRPTGTPRFMPPSWMDAADQLCELIQTLREHRSLAKINPQSQEAESKPVLVHA